MAANLTLADFVNSGYTILSEIPDDYLEDLDEYHPAVAGNLSSADYKVETKIDPQNIDTIIMVPSGNGWNSGQRGILGALRLKMHHSNRCIEHIFQPPLERGNFKLLKFQLFYIIFSGKEIYKAKLTWNPLKGTTEIYTNWFWIPPAPPQA